MSVRFCLLWIGIYRIDHLDKGKGWGSRMEGMLVVYGSGSLLAPKGKLFNNHLPEIDEKFGALLV